jgi:general secretion pathway protein H
VIRLLQWRHPGKSRGFTLIELLIVVVIIGIMAGMASLSLPDKASQNWLTRLEQLTASLNYAQEESLSRGSPMWAMVDQNGWRYFRRDRFEKLQLINHPEVFATVEWEMPMKTHPTEIRLGDDAYPTPLTLEFLSMERRAQINRDRFGHFRLQFE